MIKTAPDGTHFAAHAPGAELDYSVDWSSWLEAGETISQSSWTAATGITLTRAQLAGAVATVFAEGGVSGSQYLLTNEVTTSAGRVDSRSIILRCQVR